MPVLPLHSLTRLGSRILACTAVVFAICNFNAVGLTQDKATFSTVVAKGATPVCATSECSFTEGPAADKEGIVYFTDQNNDRIMKVGLDGKVSEYMKPAGRSNGMFFAPDGKLIACADGNNEMWEIDTATGKHKVLFGTYKDKKLNGPNDVWAHPNGKMYFTDPYYQRSWWTHKSPPQDTQAIYSVNRDGSNLTRLTESFTQPNGIVGDAKKGLLFIADIGAKKTYSFRIQADGTLTDRKLFCEEGSDGMTLDSDGRLYLTGSAGVMVYNPDGSKLETISVPERWTANVCFGGKDHKTLFITASDSLYTVETIVSGKLD